MKKSLFFGLFLVLVFFFTGTLLAATVTIDFENVDVSKTLFFDGKNCVEIKNPQWNWFTSTQGKFYKGPGNSCETEMDPVTYQSVYYQWNEIPVTTDGSVRLDCVNAWGGSYAGNWGVSTLTGLNGKPSGGSAFFIEDNYQNSFACVVNGGTDYTSSGVNGSSGYAVAYDGESVGFGPCPRVFFNDSVSILSLSVTNTYWPWLGATIGDSFASKATPGYWYRLAITGRNASGTVTGVKEIMLMDYLDSSFQAITDWESLDLTTVTKADVYTDETGAHLECFGNTPDDVTAFIERLLDDKVENSFEDVSVLEFRVSGTDGGMFGLNIAAYFALDDLVFSVADPVVAGLPEPSTVLLLLLGLCLGTFFIPVPLKFSIKSPRLEKIHR